MFTIHTAQARPDLCEFLNNPLHPLNAAWPEYLEHDKIYQRYIGHLTDCSELRKYQIIVTKGVSAQDETVVAFGRSVPFFCEEIDQTLGPEELFGFLKTLPDEGYDAILRLGVEQHLSQAEFNNNSKPLRSLKRYPNALSTISVTICPEWRSQGIAQKMIAAMKQIALTNRLRALVIPLRPTRKYEHPLVPMSEYVQWPQPTKSHSNSQVENEMEGINLPFDPWLRAHVRLGAELLKIAARSMQVEGKRADWHAWTDVDIQAKIENATEEEKKYEPQTGQTYIEVPFPYGLMPLKVYMDVDNCRYIEPNVWLYHNILGNEEIIL